MRVRRTMAKSLATLVAVLLLSASVAPAFAADDDVPSSAPIVTAAVTIGSAHLQGKTAAEARVAVLAAADEATFAPVPAVVNGRTFVLDPKLAMTVDVDRLVAAALDATDTLMLSPFAVSPSAVATFVAGMATATDRKAVNASRSVCHRRLRLTTPATGLRLDRAAAAAALTAVLDSEIAGAAPETVTVPVAVVAPSVTAANIGKTIVVSLHEFRVLVYSGTKVERVYRCAIGQRKYPTPVGTFKVVAKSAAPTWRNPSSVWSKTMPKYIRPGYSNPLGLRALYLDAPGIRIHGTAKTSSMGHAASHGCVRLTNRDVVNIYPRVPVGTPVFIVK